MPSCVIMDMKWNQQNFLSARWSSGVSLKCFCHMLTFVDTNYADRPAWKPAAVSLSHPCTRGSPHGCRVPVTALPWLGRDSGMRGTTSVVILFLFLSYRLMNSLKEPWSLQQINTPSSFLGLMKRKWMNTICEMSSSTSADVISTNFIVTNPTWSHWETRERSYEPGLFVLTYKSETWK